MAWLVWRYDGLVAGIGLVLALALFSLARLSGIAGPVAGVMTALLSLWLFREGGEPSRLFYIGLLALAGLLGVWCAVRLPEVE